MTLLSKLRALCCKEPSRFARLAEARARFGTICPPTRGVGRPYLVVKLKDDVNLPSDPAEREAFLAKYGWRELESRFGRLIVTSLFGSTALQALARQTKIAMERDENFKPTRFEKYLRIDPDKLLPLPRLAELEGALRGELPRQIFERVYVVRPGPPPGVVNWTDDPLAQYQFHLDANPFGVNAKAAWATFAGADGATTIHPAPKFVNVDCGWLVDHQDLGIVPSPSPLINDLSMAFHGAAMLGIVLARDNQFGGVGIVPNLNPLGVGLAYYDPYDPVNPANPLSLANAIGAATSGLQLGDVMLIEAQVYDPAQIATLAPPEVYHAEWNAINTATTAGIVVVEPCGNGINGGGPALNVDAAIPFGNSKAILVSAAAPWPHLPLTYSAYGSRVDCYAWGDSVLTCWDHGIGSKQDYAMAGGTSAAAAIIAGVALAVQSAHIEKYGTRLDAFQMQQKLRNPATGTAQEYQPGAPPIGIMPDLYSVILNL